MVYLNMLMVMYQYYDALPIEDQRRPFVQVSNNNFSFTPLNNSDKSKEKKDFVITR